MRKTIWILLIVAFIMSFGSTWSAEPQYVPLNNESLGLLLQQILKTKLIPCSISNDGLTVNITQLNQFALDWEKEQILMNVKFTADYDNGFFKVSSAGQIGMSGAGLIAADEQKIGVKLLQIRELKLDGSGEALNEPLRQIVDQFLAGKEFWQGNPPTQKEVLTKTNYLSLIKIAVAKALPLTAEADKNSITLNQLESITQTDTPGQFEVIFEAKGKYHQLVTLPFEGKAGLMLTVSVDPLQLAGNARIDKLTALDLKKVPSFLDSIMRSLINGKIKGTMIPFSWK